MLAWKILYFLNGSSAVKGEIKRLGPVYWSPSVGCNSFPVSCSSSGPRTAQNWEGKGLNQILYIKPTLGSKFFPKQGYLISVSGSVYHLMINLFRIIGISVKQHFQQGVAHTSKIVHEEEALIQKDVMVTVKLLMSRVFFRGRVSSVPMRKQL